MLQAMNTGHDGSLTTIHSNSPRDCLSRLETMIAMASLDLPEKAMRQQIASAVNVVIQVSRLGRRNPQDPPDLRDRRHGRRRHHHAGHLRLRASAVSARTTRYWAQFKATGIRPKFADRLKAYGIDLAGMLFSNLGDRPHMQRAAGRQPSMVGLPSSTWITALLIFFAVALGTISVALVVELLQERKRQREAFRQLRAFTNEEPEQEGILRLHGDELPRWFQPIAARVPVLPGCRADDGAGRHEDPRADVSVRLHRHLDRSRARGAGARTLVACAALAAVIGALVPYSVVRFKRNRRIGAFEEMLPEAIDLLGRAIRAGHPLSSGMKMVADETKEPDRERVPPDPRGAPVRPALRGCAARHGGPGEHHRRSDPDDRHPDSARGRRQPGRGARQPRQRDPGALHHPPPVAGIHCPGPVQRLRPGRAPDRGRTCDLQPESVVYRCCCSPILWAS